MFESKINIKAMEQTKRALCFIDKIESKKNEEEKVKLFINMMTYYDIINAENFQRFCLDILQDKSIYSRDCKLTNKIKELEVIKDSVYKDNKGNQ